MIEVVYKRLGLLRSKRVFFSDQLPETEGYHFVIVFSYNKLPVQSSFIHHPRRTVLINLLNDQDRLINDIHKNRRYKIRKGLKMKYNFHFEKPSLAILRKCRYLHNHFLVRKGIYPLISLDLLRSLSNNLTACMGIADGKLLVIMLVIHDGVVARNLFIARDESILSKDSYYIGTVLQWQTLLHFKNLHYKLYDMGGLIKGPSSLNDYKISFGGEIVPTFEYEAVLTNSAKALVKISQGLSYLVDKFKMLRTQYK